MLENYKKAKKNIEAQENPESHKPAGKTLSDILKNQKESAMLAGFLSRDGKTDVAQRLILGEISENDISILEEYRTNNNESLEKVEVLEKTIDTKYVENLASTSPEFQKIINLVGPKKAADVIKRQLQEVVVSDSSRFSSVYESLVKLNEYKSGEAKRFEDTIRSQCEKYNVDESEIAELLAIEDVKERESAIQKYVKSRYGFFKKAGDFVTQGKFSRETAHALSDNKAEMERVSTELDQYLSEMGGSLYALVSQNEQVRSSFAKELIEDQQVKKEPEPGFSEVKAEKQNIDSAWNSFKMAQNFEKALPARKDEIRREFKREAKNQHDAKPKKKGLWSRLWDSVFDKAVEDKELN